MKKSKWKLTKEGEKEVKKGKRNEKNNDSNR